MGSLMGKGSIHVFSLSQEMWVYVKICGFFLTTRKHTRASRIRMFAKVLCMSGLSTETSRVQLLNNVHFDYILACFHDVNFFSQINYG